MILYPHVKIKAEKDILTSPLRISQTKSHAQKPCYRRREKQQQPLDWIDIYKALNSNKSQIRMPFIAHRTINQYC